MATTFYPKKRLYLTATFIILGLFVAHFLISSRIHEKFLLNCKQGSAKDLEAFLDSNAFRYLNAVEPDAFGRSNYPLFLSTKDGSLEKVNLLLNRGAILRPSIHPLGNPIFEAISSENVKIMEAFIEKNPNLPKGELGASMMLSAYEQKKHSMVVLLATKSNFDLPLSANCKSEITKFISQKRTPANSPASNQNLCIGDAQRFIYKQQK